MLDGTSLMLGADSFIVSIAVSPLLLPRMSRAGLAILFGLFDALATTFGVALQGHVPRTEGRWAGPVFVVCYALYVSIVVHLRRRSFARWPVALLPILMSLDNLRYGLSDGAVQSAVASHVFALGCSSAVLSFTGLVVGRALTKSRSLQDRSRMSCCLMTAAAAIIALS